MAPLILKLQDDTEICHLTCVTGQHREMVHQILDVFGIRPDYDLDIMKEGQSLEYITSSVILKFSEVLEKEKPDLVLVHGDTTTCFAAAVAAFYKKIPVGHVEAGLRTNDIYSPFPEEFNRQTVDRISELLFVPTINNADNIKKENIPGRVYVTGNTVIDTIRTTVKENHTFKEEILNDIKRSNKRIIAITAHRRENIGKNLRNICSAIKELAGEYPDTQFIYTMHPNPLVQETVKGMLIGIENVTLLPALVFTDLHNLMAMSYLVMTDSGGLQEEAPSLGVPVLVLRKETERPEAVAAGTVKLTGVSKENILRDVRMLQDDNKIYEKMHNAVNPYGDGYASDRIVKAVKEYFRNL
jgi:UDP-N-acetylglucosamine 2-epimerase (non-hydrolysing)